MIFVLAIASLSCGGDDDAPIQDQAVGSYDYTMKIFWLDEDGELEDSGFTIDGEFEASKTSSGLSFIEDDEVVFTATKIAAASNGFTFDVPSSNGEIDDETYTIEGFDGVDLGGVKYHGLYESSTKTITSFFQLEEDGEVFVIKLVGEKR